MEKIDNIKAIGTMIREARKEQGLTQEQLATICGVGTRFLRELEQGKETCHAGKTLHVIKMLGLDLWINKRGGAV